MNPTPKVLSRAITARSKLFTIESVNLHFANGARAEFERLLSAGEGAVMVAAVRGESLLMVREYAAGAGRYELGFVKGRIDPGETARAAALRELREETGFSAKNISFVRSVHSAPAYTNFVTHIFTAEKLTADSARDALTGDEAEPPQKVEWPLARIGELYAHPQVNDARVLLALMLLEKQLAQK